MLQKILTMRHKFKHKSRVRKFNRRVFNKKGKRGYPFGVRPSNGHYSFVAFHLHKPAVVDFSTLAGIERSFLFSKNKLKKRYYRYPDYFFTKKSSHARMGKGKGKIFDRVMKIQAGTPFFEMKIRTPWRTHKTIKAVRSAMPGGKVSLKWRSRHVERMYMEALKLRKYTTADVRRRFRGRYKLQKQKEVTVESMSTSYSFFRNHIFLSVENTRQELLHEINSKLDSFRAAVRATVRRRNGKYKRRNFSTHMHLLCLRADSLFMWGRMHDTRQFQNMETGEMRELFKRASLTPYNRDNRFSRRLGLVYDSFTEKAYTATNILLSQYYEKLRMAAYYAPDDKGYTGVYRDARRLMERGKRTSVRRKEEL